MRFGETTVRLAEPSLGSFSVVDVDDLAVPIRDPAIRVMEGLANGLNPSILAVRAPELVDIVVRRAGCGRMQPTSHGRVPLIGMDEFEPPPTCQTLRGVAEIFDSPLIQVVELAPRGTAPDQCWNRLDQ